MPFVPIALFGARAPVTEPVNASGKADKQESRKVDGIRRVENCDDFTVHKSVSNNFKQLSNLDFLERYGNRIILCSTTNEEKDYKKSLESLGKRYGIQVCYADNNGNGREQKRSFQSVSDKAMLAKFAVRKEIDLCLHEKNVIFVSSESFVQDGAGAVCDILDRCNLDVASVAVIPAENKESADRLNGKIAVRANLLFTKLSIKEKSWLASRIKQTN